MDFWESSFQGNANSLQECRLLKFRKPRGKRHGTLKSYVGSAAAEQWTSFCAMQAVELLREVTGVEPLEYDRQQAADAAGVKNVAIFLTELSTR